jgi:glutamate racemase
LTVFREIARARPDARFVYAADDALFPYGKIPETVLVERVGGLMAGLIETHRPDLVVIACNTASTLVLPALRARFALPFVGTVPGDQAGLRRPRSRSSSRCSAPKRPSRASIHHALIRNFGEGCDLTLVGSGRLAALAEASLAGETG